jgi:Conserved hypothetical protein 95
MPPSSLSLAAPRGGRSAASGGRAPLMKNEVRLIGGQWKKSKLPVADRPGLRPTPDRVRETLFNWLGQNLAGWRVLDAFAGTPRRGFEAERAAAGEVVLLERDAILARSLVASKARLSAEALQVHATDALAWMASAARSAVRRRLACTSCRPRTKAAQTRWLVVCRVGRGLAAAGGFRSASPTEGRCGPRSPLAARWLDFGA